VPYQWKKPIQEKSGGREQKTDMSKMRQRKEEFAGATPVEMADPNTSAMKTITTILHCN
jgi:hypothetical protein